MLNLCRALKMVTKHRVKNARIIIKNNCNNLSYIVNVETFLIISFILELKYESNVFEVYNKIFNDYVCGYFQI